MRSAAAALLLALGAAGPLRAAEPPAADAATEAQVRRIGAELRCLVCQNQTIADSNADLANDLRRQIRELLAQGKSEREVLDYMTERYGDFVLYRPPLKPSTLLLWGGPALMLVVGAAALILVLRRRRALPDEAFEPEPAAAADDADDDRR